MGMVTERMTLKHGITKSVLSHNTRFLMSLGYPPVQAKKIAQTQRKRCQMRIEGRIVSDKEDTIADLIKLCVFTYGIK